uniref:Uncharacterized protein n=1 Tax=Plectus sambesii TaxID=2011161 RepID=A0A914WTC5_9BILA
MVRWLNIIGYCFMLLALVSFAATADDKCKANNKGGCEQANRVFNRCKGQCILEKGSCTCRANNLSPPNAKDEDSQEVDERVFLGTSLGGCYSTRDGCRNEGCGGGGGCVNFGKVPKNDCRCVLPSPLNNTTAATRNAVPPRPSGR